MEAKETVRPFLNEKQIARKNMQTKTKIPVDI